MNAPHKITPPAVKALPPQLEEAAKLVREAAMLVEKADALLDGFRHYSETSNESWPAEGGDAHAVTAYALDAYHYYIRHQVSVAADQGMAA